MLTFTPSLTRARRRIGTSLAAVLVLVPAALMAQEEAAKSEATREARPEVKWVPKTPDGQPNLQGYWRMPGGRNVYTFDIEAPAPESSYPGRAEGFKKNFVAIVVDPADGKIPYHPWARERREFLYSVAEDPKHLQDMDPQAFCVPGGNPRFAYQTQFQIFQYPGYVVILQEFSHNSRVIPLDGRPHIPDDIKLFMGDSRGHWEGDTLVVDVKNNNGRNWLDVAGDFHSAEYTIQERFTRPAANSLIYEATIQDPVVYTRPWKMKLDLNPGAPNYNMQDHACHEGNRHYGYLKLRDDAAQKDAKK